MRLAGHLLSDKEFLKYLAKAVLTDNKQQFTSVLQEMRPSVNRAIVAATIGEEI